MPPLSGMLVVSLPFDALMATSEMLMLQLDPDFARFVFAPLSVSLGVAEDLPHAETAPSIAIVVSVVGRGLRALRTPHIQPGRRAMGGGCPSL